LLDIPGGGAQRAKQKRVSDAPQLEGRPGWPVIRTNALKLDTAPVSCRIVECDIGGYSAVREAVAAAKVDVLAARRNFGVLGFGRDVDVRQAFGPFGIKRFDLHSIIPDRLSLDSAEKGLLYEALMRALARHRPLLTQRRGRRYVAIPDRTRESAPELVRLREAATVLSGMLPESTFRWSEGAWLSIEYRNDALWLLFEPTVVIDEPSTVEVGEAARSFVRERMARRYNGAMNGFFEAWALALAGGTKTGEIRALGISDGVDATFTIQPTTAFSRRATSGSPRGS
jgi:hypothetical protein